MKGNKDVQLVLPEVVKVEVLSGEIGEDDHLHVELGDHTSIFVEEGEFSIVKPYMSLASEGKYSSSDMYMKILPKCGSKDTLLDMEERTLYKVH